MSIKQTGRIRKLKVKEIVEMLGQKSQSVLISWLVSKNNLGGHWVWLALFDYFGFSQNVKKFKLPN